MGDLKKVLDPGGIAEKLTKAQTPIMSKLDPTGMNKKLFDSTNEMFNPTKATQQPATTATGDTNPWANFPTTVPLGPVGAGTGTPGSNYAPFINLPNPAMEGTGSLDGAMPTGNTMFAGGSQNFNEGAMAKPAPPRAFGGAHGGVMGGPTGTTSTGTPTAGQPNSYYNPAVNPGYTGMVDQSAIPMYYPGATVATFTPEQQQAQDMQMQLAMQQAQTLPQQYQDMIKFGTQGVLEQGNPYMQEAIQAAIRPTTQNFMENVLPGMGSAAQQQGAWGGARQGLMEAGATEGLNRTVGDIASQMSYDMYNRGLSTFENTMALAPGLNSASYMPTDVMSAIGKQKQGQNQDLINAAINRYEYQRDAPDAQLMKYLNSIGALSLGTSNIGGGGTTVNNSARPSGLSSVLGGASTGAGIGGMFGENGSQWGAAIGSILGALGK